MKRVQKEMLTDLSVFQQVLKHPEYAKDPFKTIRFSILSIVFFEPLLELNY